MIFLDAVQGLKNALVISEKNEIFRRSKKIKEKVEDIYFNDPARQMVDRVAVGEDGAFRTYVQGDKEPIRFYPDGKTVWVIAHFKRFIPLIIQNLNSMGWIKKIMTALSLWWNLKVASEWLEYYLSTSDVLLKDDSYSQPVKEIRRVCGVLKIDQNFLDAISLIVEFDSAYRYRVQDIISELNKENLIKNPKKEILRLLDIINSRERTFNPRWNQIKKIVKVGMYIPKFRKTIVSFLKEINIDEIKFSKEDIYWTNKDFSYCYRGLTATERYNENKGE